MSKEVKRNSCKKQFAYRNIKKDYQKFKDLPSITPNYHLELGENNECVIVQDRNDDWFEISQVDADKVGLINILEIARRTGENVFDGRYAFKDDEALDLSEMNPMDPESIKASISVGAQAQNKLAATAEQLGVSVDELVDAFIKGSLQSLIASKLPKDDVKDGE